MSITTIIPCYNAAEFLPESIESVLRQTRPADEIIVVDDCSTDDSAQIARRYCVQVLNTKVNSGHSAARNVGIEAAQGDLIAWLDADDYWEPNHLEVVAGLLDRFADAAVAFSAVRCFGTRDMVWATSGCPQTPANVFELCLDGTIVHAMSAMTRRHAIRSVGGFDESCRYAPDFDLWLRMSVHHQFVFTPQVTANYRWHNRQISSTPHRQRLSMLKSRVKFLHSKALEERPELREQVIAVTLAKWDMEMWDTWRQGNMAGLRAVLGLRDIMPRETPTYRTLRRRQWLPAWTALGMQWAMDQIRPVRVGTRNAALRAAQT